MSNFKRFQKPFVETAITDEQTNLITPDWQEWFLEVANILPELSIIRATIDVANKAANTVTSEAFAITAILDEDGNSKTLISGQKIWTTDDHVLSVEASAAPGLGISNPKITADNTITMDFINPTASGVNPASATYTVIVIKG